MLASGVWFLRFVRFVRASASIVATMFSWAFLIMVLLAVDWTPLLAQANFVYTNNNNAFIPNTVSAFSVASNGVLTEIADSPFPTSGTGNGGNGFIASNRITVCGNFLYASNSFSGDVSGFSVDPTTGSLTAIPGSPFAAGSRTFFGISLAATAKCDFLFAGNGDASEIFAFQIGSDGALTPVQGSPFALPSQPNGLKASPDGAFLSASLTNLGNGAIAMFSIASDGVLTPVPGSPFPISPTARTVGGIEINCASSLLFLSEGSSTVDVFNIASDGTLSLITGSPFSSPSGNYVSVLSPNGQFLFTSNISAGVNSFQVADDGPLTAVPGSPFPAGLGFSSGVAVDSAATLLYVSDPISNLVSVMQVADDGTLTLAPGSPVRTGQSGGLFSLAAFPPKTCDWTSGLGKDPASITPTAREKAQSPVVEGESSPR